MAATIYMTLVELSIWTPGSTASWYGPFWTFLGPLLPLQSENSNIHTCYFCLPFNTDIWMASEIQDGLTRILFVSDELSNDSQKWVTYFVALEFRVAKDTLKWLAILIYRHVGFLQPFWGQPVLHNCFWCHLQIGVNRNRNTWWTHLYV